MEALDCPSAPGSVAQVRLSTTRLQDVAKTLNTTVLITGHVTKTGDIAGPRTLEHMVDTVLYMEGNTPSNTRILRSMKNRFGPSNEIGVFDMTETGLEEVVSLGRFHVENGSLLVFPDECSSRQLFRVLVSSLRRVVRRHLAERLHVAAHRGESSRCVSTSSKRSQARSTRSTDRRSVAASASPSTVCRCSWRC